MDVSQITAHILNDKEDYDFQVITIFIFYYKQLKMSFLKYVIMFKWHVFYYTFHLLQIYHCQKSNQKVFNLPVHSEKTSYDDNGLHIYHTAEAHNHNRRAYVDTLARSLQCSMDVQYVDGENLRENRKQ